ncbi:biotin--[acetyl-CoA-carboxylase] ligase [bacterium]|nr:biotin--[acetyl-CoA-carboxylase] ligase [bacterium]
MRIHRYGMVTSTNDIAIEMLRRGEPERTVVTALSQSSGRGRRGRSWIDKPGDCAMISVILTPGRPISEMGELTFVMSLGVADYLEMNHNLEPALKWPNDVLVGDRKIVGILVETVNGSGAVAGIGLNVNQVEMANEIKDTATSVAIETGHQSNIDEACERLAAKVLEVYDHYLSSGFDEILRRWRERMWGIGRMVEVSSEAGSIEGTIDGVKPSGALIVKCADGSLHAIHAADAIRVIRNT